MLDAARLAVVDWTLAKAGTAQSELLRLFA